MSKSEWICAVAGKPVSSASKIAIINHTQKKRKQKGKWMKDYLACKARATGDCTNCKG